MRALGEWVEITSGFAYPSGNFSQTEVGPFLVRGDNIGHGDLRRGDGRSYWWGGDVDERYLLRRDDVVVAMDRPWISAGLKFAVVREDFVPALLVQRVARLRAASGCDQKFLAYVIRDQQFAQYVQSVQTGTGIPHISATQIADYRSELPDLATQTAIADVLGALDDKIAANEREIRLLDDLTHALTAAALVRGQRQIAIHDFAELVMGSSPRGETLSDNATGVAFHQGVRDFGVRQPTDRIFTSAPVRMARVGDVLISVRAPVGRLNRAATDLCIGRGLAAARSRHCSGATLYNLLRAAPGLWEEHGSDGTVFASISRPQLESLPVGVPDELIQLDERLTVLEARVDLLAAESAQLAATRDAILPELMSGRLSVKSVTGGASE